MAASGPAVLRQRDRLRLAVLPGPEARGATLRAILMFAARADLPVTRLDDALTVVEALLTAPGAVSADGRVQLQIEASPGSVRLDVTGLTAAAAHGLAGTPAGDIAAGLADVVDVREQPRRGHYVMVGFGDGSSRRPQPSPTG